MAFCWKSKALQVGICVPTTVMHRTVFADIHDDDGSDSGDSVGSRQQEKSNCGHRAEHRNGLASAAVPLAAHDGIQQVAVAVRNTCCR